MALAKLQVFRSYFKPTGKSRFRSTTNSIAILNRWERVKFEVCFLQETFDIARTSGRVVLPVVLRFPLPCWNSAKNNQSKVCEEINPGMLLVNISNLT